MFCSGRMMAVCRAGVDLSKSRSTAGMITIASMSLSRQGSSTTDGPVYSIDCLVYRYERLTAVLSRKSKYGLKALLALAKHAGRGAGPVSELGGRGGNP